MTERTRKGFRKTVDRLAVLNEFRAGATDKWAQSENPVKRRIGRLEIVWREAVQWLSEDVSAMFSNFGTIADAYDTLDINIAATKTLLVEKGVFTEEEFQARRGYLIGVLNAERQRRQDELQRLQAEAQERDEVEAKAQEAESKAWDKSTVTPGLKKMHRKSKEAGETENLYIPDGATVFGGDS